MTDEHRRSLDRDAALGDGGARARLLAEKLRRGELARERVALAAALGDESARTVLGLAPTTDPLAPFEALRRAGPEPSVRAAAAVARGLLLTTRETVPAWARPATTAVYEHALIALDAWLACPCAAHASVATSYARALQSGLASYGSSFVDGPAGSVIAAIAIAARSMSTPVPQALGALPESHRTRELVTRALLPWALGEEPERPAAPAANAPAPPGAREWYAQDEAALAQLGLEALAHLDVSPHRTLVARDTTLDRVVVARVFTYDHVRRDEYLAAKDPTTFTHPDVQRTLRRAVTDDASHQAIVSELIVGRPLRAWARERARTTEEIARVVARIARALISLDEARLGYGQLSPREVIVRADEDAPVLLGVGASAWTRLANRRQTRTGPMPDLDLIRFASPEVVRDAPPIGPESDAWALGAVLYELATGEPPRARVDSAIPLLVDILQGEPPAAPGPFREVVARAFVKDPTKRATLRELADALDRLS